MYNTGGIIHFPDDLWKWSISNDTIIVGGGVDFYTERYMFFKKNCDCIELMFVKTAIWEDCVVIDEYGNIDDDSSAFDSYNNDFVRQTYVEDSILVGKVNGTKFWIEFSPQYHQTGPWGYETISNP